MLCWNLQFVLPLVFLEAVTEQLQVHDHQHLWSLDYLHWHVAKTQNWLDENKFLLNFTLHITFAIGI